MKFPWHDWLVSSILNAIPCRKASTTCFNWHQWWVPCNTWLIDSRKGFELIRLFLPLKLTKFIFPWKKNTFEAQWTAAQKNIRRDRWKNNVKSINHDMSWNFGVNVEVSGTTKVLQFSKFDVSKLIKTSVVCTWKNLQRHLWLTLKKGCFLFISSTHVFLASKRHFFLIFLSTLCINVVTGFHATHIHTDMKKLSFVFLLSFKTASSTKFT